MSPWKVCQSEKGISIFEMVLVLGLTAIVVSVTMKGFLDTTRMMNKLLLGQAKFNELQHAAYLFNDNGRLPQYLGVTDQNGDVVNTHLHKCLTGHHSNCAQYRQGSQVISDFSFGFNSHGHCDPAMTSCQFELVTTYELDCMGERCQEVRLLSRLLERKEPGDTKIEIEKLERVTNPQLLFGLSKIVNRCRSVSSIDYRRRIAGCGSFSGASDSWKDHPLDAMDFTMVDETGEEDICDDLGCEDQRVFYGALCPNGFEEVGRGLKCY